MNCPKCQRPLTEIETSGDTDQKHFRCAACGEIYAWHEDCRNLHDRGLHACSNPAMHLRVPQPGKPEK
jgi:hypothetical protein